MEERPILKPNRRFRAWAGLAIWIGVCFGAAATGSMFPIDQWYRELNRPSFAPPDFVFGPVWSILYLSMAVSAWLIWQRDGCGGAKLPLAFFLIQLGLNAAWSWLFFGLHQINWAFFEMLGLSAAILITLILFFRRRRVAGFLLVPYLAWVVFASVLTFEYWRLNP